MAEISDTLDRNTMQYSMLTWHRNNDNSIAWVDVYAMPTIVNHWGVYTSSADPLTAVFNANEFAQTVSDEMVNGIDLDYEAWLEDHDCPGECNCEDPDNCENDDHGDCQCEYESDTWEGLIGDWLKDEDGKYYPDPEGEYAAIVGEVYIQVVFSQSIKYGVGLCSPCYPGQADPDSDGIYKCYDMPKWAYESDTY